MDKNNLKIATLGAGCFWCIEKMYRDLKGVESVESGYMGGKTQNPTYEEICGGESGHAEVINVHFDPNIISYETILEIFWHSHDPTTLNRQGNDIGTQYRSAVFFYDEEQENIANDLKQKISAEGIWPDPIVTEITPASEFFRAEDYHQNYFELNPEKSYCQVIINPKIQKFRIKYKHLLR